jgi:hypothetical protein
MNIFEIFCNGNGRINGTNISSILGFLLHPGMAHNLGKEPLKRIVALASESLSIYVMKSPENGVTIAFEEPVYDPNGHSKRYIDLVIRINDQANKLALVVAIENKIHNSAMQDAHQLKEEYQFLRAKLNEELNEQPLKNVPILFFFITPFEQVGANVGIEDLRYDVEKNDDTYAHISWSNGPEQNRSITKILNGLLDDESSGKIQPASSHTSLFLRSMINFIRSGFRRLNPVFEHSEYEAVLVREMAESAFLESFPRGTAILAAQLIKSLSDYAEESIKSIDQPKIPGLGFSIRYSSTRATFYLKSDKNSVNELNRSIPSLFIRVFRQNPTNNNQIMIAFKTSEDSPFNIDQGKVVSEHCKLEMINNTDINLLIYANAMRPALSEDVSNLISDLVSHAITSQLDTVE